MIYYTIIKTNNNYVILTKYEDMSEKEILKLEYNAEIDNDHKFVNIQNNTNIENLIIKSNSIETYKYNKTKKDYDVCDIKINIINCVVL